METVKETEEKSVNYLVNNYEDLRDVVTTIEQMIADIKGIKDKPSLRKGMRLTIIPLKGKDSSIIKINLSNTMTVQR